MLNRVFIAGYLGRDPETRVMPNGKTVTNFSIATTEKWTDKSGERQEKTEWHNIVAFDKKAEAINEYVRKGTPLLVEGKLQTRKWQDKEGNDRYSTEIVLSQFTFLPNPNRGRADGDDTASRQNEVAHQETDGGFDDDIPF